MNRASQEKRSAGAEDDAYRAEHESAADDETTDARGIGTDRLRVEGVRRLAGATHRIVPDRIEAGTFACAAAITGGAVLLEGARLDRLGAVARILREAGVEVAEKPAGLRVSRMNGLSGTDVMTEPFPGFATDMQAQFMAINCVAEGTGVITETIFENRFMHVQELLRLGADIRIEGNTAVVIGTGILSGATVMATDLRASAGLVIAGLCAQGQTVVERIYHLDRGYARMEEKLAALGARIERLTAPPVPRFGRRAGDRAHDREGEGP